MQVWSIVAIGMLLALPAALLLPLIPLRPLSAPTLRAPAAIAARPSLVELIATIGTDDAVRSVTAVKGDPFLIKAAQDAIMQWRYRPAMLNASG
jgi:hypothetical protein